MDNGQPIPRELENHPAAKHKQTTIDGIMETSGGAQKREWSKNNTVPTGTLGSKSY